MHLVLLVLLRVKRRGEKLPATGGALVAANHYSFLDAFLMGSGTWRWIRYLLWKPYYENKYAQPFAKALFCIPMAQEGIREIISNLRGAQAVIKEGHMVGIFPEGEITRTGAMGLFRRGYEKILQGTDAPIIPMHISGLWRHPLSPSPAPWFPWRRWPVTISIGKPLPAETTPEELQRQVLRLIGETLAERIENVVALERATEIVPGLTFGALWREAKRARGGKLEEARAEGDREFAVEVLAAVLALGEGPVMLDGVAVRQQDLLAVMESAAMYGVPKMGRWYEFLFAMVMGRSYVAGAGEWMCIAEMGGPVALGDQWVLGVTARVDSSGRLHLLGPGREEEWATGRVS